MKPKGDNVIANPGRAMVCSLSFLRSLPTSFIQLNYLGPPLLQTSSMSCDSRRSRRSRHLPDIHPAPFALLSVLNISSLLTFADSTATNTTSAIDCKFNWARRPRTSPRQRVIRLYTHQHRALPLAGCGSAPTMIISRHATYRSSTRDSTSSKIL